MAEVYVMPNADAGTRAELEALRLSGLLSEKKLYALLSRLQRVRWDPTLSCWWARCPCCGPEEKRDTLVVRSIAQVRCTSWCSEGAVTLAVTGGSLELREPGADDGIERPSTMLGLRPVAELLSEKLPEIDWLVAPYLEAGGSLAALVAPPNLGKTLLATWLCTQVAASKRRVAVIELEGGRRGLQKRLSRAIEACGGLEVCGLIDYAFKPRLSLMSTADIEKMCVELQGYGLIVLDSLACATAGLEENEAVAMGLVVSALQRIAIATGCTILIIHHTGKTKWKPGADAPSVGDGRGSGVLDAALDTVLALAPLNESEQEKGSVSFGLYVTKQRDEEKAEPQIVRILMTGPAAIVTMEAKSEQSLRALDSRTIDVLAALTEAGEAGWSKKQIEDRAGGNRERVRAILVDLKMRGEAEEVGEYRYKRWRLVPRSAALSPISPDSPGLASGEPSRTISPTRPPVRGGEASGASRRAEEEIEGRARSGRDDPRDGPLPFSEEP